tara:strand:- start:482 stop:814 length:333 start_codon:yes stop_codon:yes gene_type:complete
MKKIVKICSIALFVALSASVVSAADATNGKQLARKCSVCHGRDGLSRDSEVPSLAGQPEYYLRKSMTDFKVGAREDRRMSLMARAWDDEDIMDLAAWFSSIIVTVEMPAE